MAEYKKLRISANTLVPRGAVGEKAIFKDADGRKIIKAIEIKKDDLKLEMNSIMYMLNKEDSQGDIVKSANVLEDACLDFMQNGSKVVKFTHDGENTDALIKELYIVPAGHPVWTEKKYTGALANVIKFTDENLYSMCKEKDWETSIEGDVVIEDDAKKEENLITKIYNMVMNKFKKGVDLNPEEVPKEPEQKAEIAPEIMAYVQEIVNAKFEEIKAMIEGGKVQTETEIEAMKTAHKEELKELRKDFVLSAKEPNDKPAPKVKKTMLS